MNEKKPNLFYFNEDELRLGETEREKPLASDLSLPGATSFMDDSFI